MGVEDLIRALAAVGVEPGAVAAEPGDGRADRVWCVRPVAADDAHDGDEVGEDGSWEIFWSEGGERWAWTRFDEESTACFALFGRLVWSRVLRGALVPARPPAR